MDERVVTRLIPLSEEEEEEEEEGDK